MHDNSNGRREIRDSKTRSRDDACTEPNGAKKETESKSRYWRGLEDLYNSSAANESRNDEFPSVRAPAPGASHRSPLSRREVLRYIAASAALAGLSACTKLPSEKIVPYVHPPEEIVAGKPLFYATSAPLGLEGIGLLVESHMGRPTKIEGNPGHPGSVGHTDIFAQAAILDLYDPDRSQTVIHDGQIGDWPSFTAQISSLRSDWTANKGVGLRILTETITTPTLAAQIHALLVQFPGAKWHQYDAAGHDTVRDGAKLAFGEFVNTFYRIDRADIIVSLDADFLNIGPGHVRYARDFAARRSPDAPARPMNRLYVAESTPSITGAMADHRLAIRASDVETLARALAANLGLSQSNSAAQTMQAMRTWIDALTRDLQAHRGASIIIAGEQQPPAVHALAHYMNEHLSNVGQTVTYTEPLETAPVNTLESLRELTNDLNAGKVQSLVIIDANPAYNAPADFDFVHAYLKSSMRVHVGLYYDETAELSNWHVPQAHFLETWGETRAYDGTIGIIQPLIAPMYAGKSALEIIAEMASDSHLSGHEIIRNYWMEKRPAQTSDGDFEDWWEKILNDGVVAGTALSAKTVPVNFSSAPATSINASAKSEGLEIVFRPDPSVGDGRYANNAWLQELPKPLSHLTWDNALMLSPATANKLGLKSEDYVNLNLSGWKLGAPVWIMPGHADESATLHLGYGRSKTGEIGTRRGVNPYFIRTSNAPWIALGLQIEKTSQHYPLATTQHHHLIGPMGEQSEAESVQAFERDLVQVTTLAEFQKDPNFVHEGQKKEEAENPISLYPGYQYTGYAWGMSIDLNRCVGCNACVIACQAENNISVVGKEQVLRGREMHWIRVDSYFHGGVENPEMYFEPMPCMQCEDAPCEVVCPVGATNHSPEGLNNMVYNRCVGTRYCSNNCPYKVRRFNFLLFSDFHTQSLYGMRNPNVTVRSRGVMEKCTYCVQRINEAKITSQEEDRLVRDGEIQTACQQVCPADAIVFGNINDKSSRVAKLKADPRDYKLLEVLNTRPRTSYLARIRNPNPDMPQQPSHAPAAGATNES